MSRRAPDQDFLYRHPAHFLALGFGAGLSPVAPGTFGTLFGWLLFIPLQNLLIPLQDLLPLPWFWLFWLVFLWLGTWACARAGRALGEADHGAIVIDEIVAIWLVLAFTPAHWGWQLWAVLLFRLFDIAKPPPVRWADARCKNAFGVMLDDLLAAGYSLFALALSLWLYDWLLS